MRENIRSRLRPSPPDLVVSEAPTSDYDLNPGARIASSERELRSAAVLVPLIEHPAGTTVLLTRRTEHLHKHAGQISFPGGAVEPGDRDAVATALRETEEEIGLTAGYVEIAGFLDIYETVTGFQITPVVGFVRPGFTLALDSFEVAEAFEVPLSFLMDPNNHQRHYRTLDGGRRYYYAIPYGDYYVWGATAGMLMNLYRRLQPDS